MADLALGKSSHRAWTSPVTRRASCSRALGMRVGDVVRRGAEGPCVHSGARPRVLSDACAVHCEGVFAAIIGSGGRGPEIPAVGLRNRCCVVKPDPITTQGQSPWGRVGRRGAPLHGRCGSYNVLLQFALVS